MRAADTFRKFETCITKLPKAKQVKTDSYNKGTLYPIISQEEKLISGYCDDESMLFGIEKPVVIFGDHTRVLKYVDFDFIVGADGVKILSPIEDIDAKFLFYYLTWYNIPNLGYSRHYKLLKKIDVPIPKKETQYSIVKELDQINALIEIKEKQLRELEELEQTIFYEMFGDPNENEKGWIVKPFMEIFKVTTGKLDSNAMVPGGKYPFFTCAKEIFAIDDYAFDCEALLLAGNNATANYDVKHYNGKFNAYQRTYVLTLKEEANYEVFKIQLENRLNYLKQMSLGANTKYLTLKILSKLKFIMPPLALQQVYSKRQEMISELRKEDLFIIANLQELLASRMQYWFD